MTSRLLIFILVLLVYPQHGFTQTTTAKPPQYCTKPLTLAYYGDWYPYMFAVNDHYEGSDWLLLKKILQQLKCEITVEKVPEKRAHNSLIKRQSLVILLSAAFFRNTRFKD